MKQTNLFLLFLAGALTACSPKISTSLTKQYPPLLESTAVSVIEIGDSIPPKSEMLGRLKVGDSGFTMKCDYNTILEAAKLEARKVGGNAIEIVTHQYPGLISTCHQITANILKVHNLSDLTNNYATLNASDTYVSRNEAYSHWRFALNGGLTYNLGKADKSLDQQLQTYYKQLRFGTQLGAEVIYFLNETSGIGFCYYSLATGNSLDGVTLSYGSQVVAQGVMSDDINLSFIGPMYSGRMITGRDKNNALVGNVGIGYMGYTDNVQLGTYHSKIKGGTVGFLTSIGYDHAISKSTSLGVQLSLVSGSLWQYDQFDGTTTTHVKLNKDNFMSLGHIDLSVGLRFNTPKRR